MRKLPLPSLKKKLWRLFSPYIRRREADQYGNVKCISCSAFGPWKGFDAGHYLKGTFLGTWIDERNVHAQCVRCNHFLDGNQSSYAIALIRKYGPGILEELDSLKHSRDKYSRIEYEELIEIYKKKLKDLEPLIYGARL